MKKIIIKVIIFILIAISGISMATNILNFNDKFELVIKDYYDVTKDNNIDMFFIGSSQTYSTFDSKLIEDRLNINVYGLSVAGQKFSQSYYLLREALKYDNPKVVIFETYSLFNSTKNNTQMNSRVSQNMRWSNNKKEYLINEFGYLKLIENYIPLLRFHNNYNNPKIISKNLKNYGVETKIWDNYYRGYLKNKKTISSYKYKKYLKEKNDTASVNTPYYDLYNKQLDYFNMCLDLCEKNNIKVILVKTPVIPYVGSIEKYSNDYASIIEDISKKRGINYIDYNFLVKQLDINYHHYRNINHVNDVGAQIISNHFIEYYKSLYDSVESSNIISNTKYSIKGKRAIVTKVIDPIYGEGNKIEKVKEIVSYSPIARILKRDIDQPGKNYKPYELTCIIKNISGLDENIIKKSIGIYNAVSDSEIYQYRSIKHIEDNYYKVTIKLDSNVGKFIQIAINCNLPLNKAIEIYNMQINQKYYQL